MPFFGGPVGGGGDYHIISNGNITGAGAGSMPLLTGINNMALGTGALLHITTGSNNIAIGDAAGSNMVVGMLNILLGVSSAASLANISNNIIVGNNAAPLLTTGGQNVIIGTANDNGDPTAKDIVNGDHNVLIGSTTQFPNNPMTPVSGAVVIGYNAAGLNNTVVIGTGANALDSDHSVQTNFNGIAIGAGARAFSGTGCAIAIGPNASAVTSVIAKDSIAIGNNANAHDNGIAIGTRGISQNVIGIGDTQNCFLVASLIQIGDGSGASAIIGMAIGKNASASGQHSVVLGEGSSDNSFNHTIAIGQNIGNSAANQIIIGDNTYTSITIGGIAFGPPVTDLTAPATGFTYTVPNGTASALINPAGTLATGTINMPAVPTDGQKLTIASSQQITALTMSGNGKTLLGALVTIGANGFATWQYRASITTWFRVG